MNERVLFLQLAGTIVPDMSLLARPLQPEQLQLIKDRIRLLNELCERTKATIVINSDVGVKIWNCDGVVDKLILNDLKVDHLRLIDRQTLYPLFDSEDAVHEWLTRHPGVAWVALDADLHTNHPNYVVTTSEMGLCPQHIDLAVTKFQNQNVKEYA
jgi:hypothetical protein